MLIRAAVLSIALLKELVILITFFLISDKINFQNLLCVMIRMIEFVNKYLSMSRTKMLS